MARRNRRELILAIASATGSTEAAANRALSAILEAITAELVNRGRVQIVGFGTFEATYRVAQNRINPATNQPVTIDGGWVPRFRAGSALKQACKESTSHA